MFSEVETGVKGLDDPEIDIKGDADSEIGIIAIKKQKKIKKIAFCFMKKTSEKKGNRII